MIASRDTPFCSDRVQRSDSKRLVRWYGQGVARDRRFQNDVAPTPRDRQKFVADEVKANAGRRTFVEPQHVHSFEDRPAEFVPRVSLREDAFRQARGAVAAVRLLHNFKHQFMSMLERDDHRKVV
jgi:hypothetical protein